MHHHGLSSSGAARLATVVLPPGNDYLVGNDGAWTAEASDRDRLEQLLMYLGAMSSPSGRASRQDNLPDHSALDLSSLNEFGQASGTSYAQPAAATVTRRSPHS